MQKKLVLLDFDGVIADTFHIVHAVARKMCVKLDDHAEYRKQFDGNIYESTKAFFAEDHGDKCDHDLDYWASYVPRFYKDSRPFKEVVELLPRLASDHLLFIVTSTRRDLVEFFLEKNALKSVIEGIWGLEASPNKNEKIEEICTNYEVSPRECIFVTDTLGDINEASGVGVSSIGVTWGFQDRATLERGEPFRIIDAPSELEATIAEYFASRKSVAQ